MLSNLDLTYAVKISLSLDALLPCRVLLYLTVGIYVEDDVALAASLLPT